MNKLYTIGYGNINRPALQRFVEQHKAIVADVRMKPWSPNPTWRGYALKALLGERYIHLQSLGNVNYKGGPIQLVNEADGIASVSKLLEDQPVILLCACKDVHTCHRKNAAAMLAEALGCEVQHLTPADFGLPSQLGFGGGFL